MTVGTLVEAGGSGGDRAAVADGRSVRSPLSPVTTTRTVEPRSAVPSV